MGEVDHADRFRAVYNIEQYKVLKTLIQIIHFYKYSKTSVNGLLYVTVNLFGPVECYRKNTLIHVLLNSGHSN
jgi:hypothetical protein